MPQKHKTKEQIVQSKRNPIADLEREVHYLELNVKKNEYQHKLTGMYIETYLTCLIDHEILSAEKYPDLLPVAAELRNDFIRSIGMSEPEYLERLQKDLKAREDAKPKAPPVEALNPSDALHAIHEEIQGQEEGKELKEAIADIPTPPEQINAGMSVLNDPVLNPEPAIEPIDVTGGATNEPDLTQEILEGKVAVPVLAPEIQEEIPVIPMTELGVRESDIF